MELLLKRVKQVKNATCGLLYINGEHFCYTLEDKVRTIKVDCSGKIKGSTAIPEGKYKVILSYSNRFKKTMPLLLNVPCFTGIRIHSGNTHADTEGCILVGLNQSEDNVFSSRVCFNALMNVLYQANLKESIYIVVQNFF